MPRTGTSDAPRRRAKWAARRDAIVDTSAHVFAQQGEHAEQFRVRRREYERRVEAVLQAGIESGEFREVDLRLTTLAWLGMHNYTYLWLKVDGRLSARDVAEQFGELFIRGIATT